MIMNIYVGNIPFRATQEELEKVFGEHGDVTSVFLPTDRVSGRPRGFGFVEMDDDGGKKAIQELDGFEMDGRNLRVNEARPKEERR
ncbi:MAG: RNA-binding protein [Dehalococcoidia bacterium]|nr:RNA-binding protein [Dehalococcoidia bacterium]